MSGTEDPNGFGSLDFEETAPKFDAKSLDVNSQEYLSDGVQILQEKKKDFYDFLTAYHYKNPRTGKTEKIPVPIRWHPKGVFNRIVQHNKLGQYTGIVEIGMSGSGKTTLTRMFLHRLHEMGENYIVKWFTGADMLNIDKIIDGCIVGMPHVLIFDDASYTMEDAKKDDVARLANALTTIRHHIKSRVITIMNIHYSKATKKFFRNQHFTFLTSISTEELGNFADLFKGKMNVVMKFAKVYNSLMLKGYFDIPISSYSYKKLRMKTNEPFRVGLVAEISDLHFFLYARESCNICDPKTDSNTLTDYNEILDRMCKRWSAREVRSALQYFTMIYEGANINGEQILDPRPKEIFRYLAEMQRQVKLPLMEMLETARDMRQRGPPKSKGSAKKFREMSVMDLTKKFEKEMAEGVQKDIETESDDNVELVPPGSMKKPQSDGVSTTGYDSLFVGSKNKRSEGNTDKK